ncbi:MAG: extracellular solute-binding protein [Caldicoprobacterales bacterium]
MRLLKKSLSIALMMVLVLTTLLAGCGGDNKTPATNADKSTPPATSNANNEQPGASAWELGSEELEFSYYHHYGWYTMPNWGEDPASKWILENKKVKINAISSGGDAEAKMSTILISGELPDAIWMERGAEVEKLRSEGLLVPLDDYIEKYPNYKKWVMSLENIDMLRSPDGKLYQIPNWYTSQPNGNTGYVVNKKIYETLGSPRLETTEDLYSYLVAVKNRFPDVTPLEVGEGADGIEYMMSAFKENRSGVFYGSNYMAVPSDGKFVSLFTDPAYREGMQFVSRLFREKLISPDTFTQLKEEVDRKMLTGKVAVYITSSPTEMGSQGDMELKKQDPNDGYFMIWPIAKPGLDRNKIYTGDYKQLGWNVTVITKAAKDPEKIFAFFDWLTGPEGQCTVMWGPRGIYWDGFTDDGWAKFTDAYANDPVGRDEMTSKTEPINWAGNTVFVDVSKAQYESTLPVEKQNWQTRFQREITWKTQQNTTEFININPASDSDEGIIRLTISDIYDQARASAIQTAKSDAEVISILDEAEKQAQAAGYQVLLDYMTARWQENINK